MQQRHVLSWLFGIVVALGLGLAGCPLGGGGGGSSGDPDGGAGEGSPSFAMTHPGGDLDPAQAYNIPMNADPASSNVALFSQQKDRLSVRNGGTEPITITAVTLVPEAGTMAEEFDLRDFDSLLNEPLVVDNDAVAPGETFDFYVRFYPVFSGERAATLTIEYLDGGEPFTSTLRITGTGRPSDNLRPLADATLLAHKLLGTTGTDEQAVGMAADDQGNTYFLLQTKQLPGYDGFYYDLVLGLITPEGTLGWTKIFSRASMWEFVRDPGQNDETGGSPNAIVYDDGSLYIACSLSEGNGGNNLMATALKVNAADGAVVWQKMWRPEWPEGSESTKARMGSEAYSLATGGDYVYVTGTCGSGSEDNVIGGGLVMLLGLAKTDGSLLFQRGYNVAEGYNDRGHAIGATADGRVIVGGLTNGRGLAMGFTGADTADPQIAWVKHLNMGLGSNVYALDLDSTGAYLAADRRGGGTLFSVIKLDIATGATAWMSTYASDFGDNNNANTISVVGDQVFAGGRIGFSVMDNQFGDGFITSLDAATGAENWSGIYYTGKGPNEMCEHRIKGVTLVGDKLYAVGQVYTGNTGDENYRYDGYWYQGLGEFAPDTDIAITDLAAADVAVIDPATDAGEARDLTAVTEADWDDLPEQVVWIDALDKKNGQGATADEDFFWMKLDLAP